MSDQVADPNANVKSTPHTSTAPTNAGAVRQPAAAPVSSGTTDEQPVAMDVSNFNAYYDEFHAVRNLSMKIPSKRVTALIGPSGCGKSTLLRWLNRMNDLIPGARAEGNVVVGGRNILDRKVDVVDLRRRIGMVFQRPNPFPKSIYDNVAFGPRLHHQLTKSETDELVEACLTKAALWGEVKDRLNSSALGLSGGQQQRLCIARGIATGPEILLMDEPCSALDPASTLAIEELISELREDFTIVIVTHNMQQARRVSDKTAFMYTGDLIEYGGTSRLFTEPQEKQTADYIQGKFG